MFIPLTREEIRQIVDIQFWKIKETLLENQVKIRLASEGVDRLAELAYDPLYGADLVFRNDTKEKQNT